MPNFANPQEETWAGAKGDKYASDYTIDPRRLNGKWVKSISGVGKTTMNDRCFGPVPKDASILEVGCNVGNMLLMMKAMGWTNLRGLELNKKAVGIARKRGFEVEQGNALELPFEDNSFDLVYTCWVISHIDPKENLGRALDEIHRVSRRWISGCEPYYPGRKIINLRPDYLWRGDYSAYYRRRFGGLALLNTHNYGSPRVKGWSTEMFLLEKQQCMAPA